MKIHHIRNATLIVEADPHYILVDPMLGSKGSLPPLTFFRFKPKRNPTVALPKSVQPLLDKVTHCLITHRHPDHIDKAAEKWLHDEKIPVICSIKDSALFKKKGLKVTAALKYWQRIPFLGGKLEGIPALHGYGFIAKPMGPVMGFYLELPQQPSVYISSDTIYTSDVAKVLKDYKPQISVVACGSAQLDIFKPLLMNEADIVRFVNEAPGKVVANHMEAVNHCPTSRKKLKEILKSNKLLEKVFIPKDGEAISV